MRVENLGWKDKDLVRQLDIKTDTWKYRYIEYRRHTDAEMHRHRKKQTCIETQIQRESEIQKDQGKARYRQTTKTK